MNLLITGAWKEAPNYIDQINGMGHMVSFMQYEQDELPCAYDWVDGVICNGLFLSHPIEKFVNLKYIQLTSAGFDRVPIDYVKEHNITIHNARGVYSIPMAEFAITGVLQLYKQMRFFAENKKVHCWEKHRGLLELHGKTVCIVGCGSVGTECAKRFQAFGCNVIGVDLFPRDDRNYEKMVSLSKLDTELSQSDVIVFTLPLTDETKYMMNRERFSALKEGAVIVNIARGAILNTKALLDALPKLGGAVLDVFEEEPLDDGNRLWDADNVIVTPHNSFIGDGNRMRLYELIVRNISQIQ